LKILIIGSGGREHALAWQLKRCASVSEVIIAPGNPGTARVGRNNPTDPPSLIANKVDLTIVGPEAPLVDGLVDRFRAKGFLIFGPTRAASQLEGSKIFAKSFMARHGIPTARYEVAYSLGEARAALKHFSLPVVLKADGLAAGKGVVVAASAREAESTVTSLFDGTLVGEAGSKVVIEEFLAGEEVSFIAVSDGRNIVPLEPSQDHKAVFDGDQGPNTGGMGAYSDSRILTGQQRQEILDTVMRPVIDGMAASGTPFAGFLYAGLMMTAAGPKVLEFNVRLGDPETQCLLHRLDCDFAAFLYEAARGHADEKLLRFRADPSVCVVMASPGYPAKPRTGQVIEGIEAAEANGATVFHAGTRATPEGIVTAGGRVLGVTHSGASLAAAIHNTYEAVKKIRFEGMHYRSDIGRKGLSRYNEH